jgi:hypothetical protein
VATQLVASRVVLSSIELRIYSTSRVIIIHYFANYVASVFSNLRSVTLNAG